MAVRKERMLEKAAHQDALIAGKRYFGAGTVMHIEIDHSHALQPMLFQSISCRNGNIIQKAEAHRLSMARMVAGWAYRAKGLAVRIAHYGIHSGNTRTGGRPCRF